jgi:TPR repeat protein
MLAKVSAAGASRAPERARARGMAVAAGLGVACSLVSPWLGAQPVQGCEAMAGEGYSEPPETVEIELDAARWHVASRLRSLARARKEFVLADETVQNWTQLVTWEVTFRTRQWDLARTRDTLLKELRARCDGVKSNDIEVKPKELIYEWSHEGCAGRPPQHEITRLIEGEIGTHHLTYDRRGAALTAADRERWIAALRRAPVRERLSEASKRSAVDRARIHAWTGDYATAVAILRPLADGGLAEAQEEFARLYFEGWGVSQDHAEAVRWFEKAAAQRFPAAVYNLARMHENGWGVAAADPARARGLYKDAAELGSAEAQGRLAVLLATGSEPDYAAARRWFEQAAAQDHVDAVYWLGRLFEEGWGVERDLERAVYWYRQAAEQGDGEAQYRLGRLYADGAGGLPASDSTSILWLTRAAMQGVDEARTFYHQRFPEPRPSSSTPAAGSVAAPPQG